MASTGLIVFLPLVGAILGGIVGAFGGAWANSWYRDREAKKAQDRELKGLMVLMSYEYARNRFLLQTYTKDPDAMNWPGFTDLQTGVWTEVRIRLAQFLPTEEIAAFTLYYSIVESIKDVIRDAGLSAEEKARVMASDIKEADKYGKAAMAYAAKYIFVDHPEYTKDVHERYLEVAERLMRQKSEDD